MMHTAQSEPNTKMINELVNISFKSYYVLRKQIFILRTAVIVSGFLTSIIEQVTNRWSFEIIIQNLTIIERLLKYMTP